MYTARIHPRTRPYPALTRPGNGHVRGRLRGHGPHTAVYTCVRIHGPKMVMYTALNGCVTAVYTCTPVHGPCTRTDRVHCPYMAVYTARTRPCTRPCNGHVHMYTCTRAENHNECVYFLWVLPLHGPCTRPCTRHAHARIHSRVTGVPMGSTYTHYDSPRPWATNDPRAIYWTTTTTRAIFRELRHTSHMLNVELLVCKIYKAHPVVSAFYKTLLSSYAEYKLRPTKQ